MIFWALLPRWVKIAVPGVILAAGGALWLWHRAYTAGQLAERLTADREAVKLAEGVRSEKAAAVADAFRQGAAAIRAANQLHDSVRVVDTVTVLLSGPTLTPVAPLPAIVVRRIVADSLALGAERLKVTALQAQVVADSGVIRSLEHENATLLQMKSPPCGAKCKMVAVVATAAVAAEAVIRLAQVFKPHR